MRSQGWLWCFDLIGEWMELLDFGNGDRHSVNLLDSMASSSSRKNIHADATDDEQEQEEEVSVYFHRTKLLNLNWFWFLNLNRIWDGLICFRVDGFTARALWWFHSRFFVGTVCLCVFLTINSHCCVCVRALLCVDRKKMQLV